MKRGDRRGVALAVVLAMLVTLGVIAAGMGRAVRLEADTVATLRARTVARYGAESGVVAAEWRIQTLLDSAQSLPDWAAEFQEADAWLRRLGRVTLGDAQFEVAVIDLGARVDLNRSSAGTVRGLLEQFTGQGRAADIVTAIKARPLYRVGELALIPGVDDELATAVAPYVTVWGDGTVNLNSAPEPVLAAVQEIGKPGARNIIMRRESGEIFDSDSSILPESGSMAGVPAPEQEEDSESEPEPEVAPDDLGFTVSTAPTRLLIIARGWRVGHPLTHEVQAVYAVMETRLTLQIWQERDL